MSLTIEGLKNLAAIIIADRNNELELMINKNNWEFIEILVSEGNGILQTEPPKVESEVISVSMPVLKGLDSGKDWIEILRVIGSWETNNPAVI